MNTKIITHYYLSDKPPFLSLSDLEGDVSDPVFQGMLHRHKHDPKYNRRYGLEYLSTRFAVEEKLRKLFIQQGGKPTRKYPIYFVLGESKWFEFLNGNHEKVQIPVSGLAIDKVSVTFPDSYIAMMDTKKPYYEKVYFLDEIEEIVSRYGKPKDRVPDSYEKYWEGDFELYYEVQVWDDEILKPYLCSQ